MAREQAVYAVVLARALANPHDIRLLQLQPYGDCGTVGELVAAVHTELQRILKDVVHTKVYNSAPTEQTLDELENNLRGTLRRRDVFPLDEGTAVTDEHRGESGQSNPYFVVLTFASEVPGARAPGTVTMA